MIKNKTCNCFGKIFGLVQGVGYRIWLKKTAESYKFGGWVKNCKDKTVEFEVNGEKEKIEYFIKDCYKGPLLSKVSKIDIKFLDFQSYKEFEIKY